MSMEIILAAVIVGGTGLLLGLFLGLAGKKFAVEIDEKEQQVREQLPGYSCMKFTNEVLLEFSMLSLHKIIRCGRCVILMGSSL